MSDEKRVVFVLVLVIALVVVLSLKPVFTGYSVNEGENEPSIIIHDALPGSTIKAELTLETNTDSLSYGKVLATGASASWIYFLSEDYAFLPELPTSIPVYFTIPEDTPEGEYTAKIALLAQASEDESFLDDQIISYIPVTIFVRSEEHPLAFIIHEFTFYPSEEQQKVPFTITLENVGNTEGKAFLRVEVFDDDGKIVSTQTLEPHFLAYEKKEIVAFLPEHLEKGEYTAYVSLQDEMRSTLFSIVEEGTLTRKGELLYLDTQVTKDSLVTLRAYFHNSGETGESPILTGRILHNEDIVLEFETEEHLVLPGTYEVFTYRFSQPLDGAYSVDADIRSGNIVFAEDTVLFYSSDAVGLESSVIVLISLVMLLLVVSHYLLSRRKEA